MAIRDDISQSARFRGNYNDEADTLAVIERAFGGRVFQRALHNVMQDMAEQMADEVAERLGGSKRTQEESRRKKRQQEREESQDSGHRGGYSGRFVGSAAPKAKHMRSKTHVPRREAGIPDEHGRNIRQFSHLDDFDAKAIKQELEDLEDYLRELKATRRGEDYILLPNLRKEIDRLSVLEGSMAKGLLRKGLSSMPGIGGGARRLYEFKDSRKQAKRNKVRMDALIQANEKRMTTLRNSLMDADTRRSQKARDSIDQVEDAQLHVAQQNQDILKKILRQARPGQAESLDRIPIPRELESAALSALPAMLRGLLGFLASPTVWGPLALIVGGVLATQALRELMNKIVDEHRAEDKKIRDAKASELAGREANQGMTNAELKKAAQAQMMQKRGQDGGDTRNGAFRDQLSPMRKKFMDQRATELAVAKGPDGKYLNLDAHQIHTQVEKDYTTNPDAIKGSPVARILDKDLRREGMVGSGQNDAPVRVTPGRPGAVSANGSDAFIEKGSGVDIDGLQPAVKSNLMAMAQEYYALTGKKLILNSAHRSRAQQEELYRQDPTKAAPPGRSMHEYGYAFDINTDTANVLSKSGLLQKYGFTRPIVHKEGWHIESSAIQGQKDAIRAGAAPVAAGAVSVARAVPEGEGTTPGSSSAVTDSSYERTPYESPGASAARATATVAAGSSDAQPSGDVKVSGASGGAQNLNTIPVMVDNLNLALYNSGAVR